MLLHATFLAVVSLAAAAPASPPARPLVVLVDSSPAMPPELRAQLVPALQAEVERSAGYRWSEPPPVSVDELALALNCDGMDDACLRRAADSLKTEAVLLVSVSSGGRREVTLSLVHVKVARPSKVLGVTLSDVATTVTEVRTAARGLLGPVRPTRLLVLTEPAGAQVTVDGRPVGKSPVTLADITEGAHRVTVGLSGYQDQETQVQVPLGQATEVRLSLVAAVVAVAPREKPAPSEATVVASPDQPAATPSATESSSATGAETAAAPVPAWHALKWVSPAPGIITALVAMAGLAVGVSLTAVGAHGYTSETGPTEERSLRGAVFAMHDGVCGRKVQGACRLFAHNNEDAWMLGTTTFGVVLLGGSVVAFLVGVALLAAAPVPILMFE